MIKLKIPVVVEGKYDKARLAGIVDAPIITTDGFGIFNNEEKRALLRLLGKNGLILLCDSDGGGRLIRSHLRGILDGITVYDLYTPQVEGKERRKDHRSKAGLLGVEGIESDVLTAIFEKFASAYPELTDGESGSRTERKPITAAVLYELGLTGVPDAAANRAKVCRRLGLPAEMTAKAFAEAAAMLTDAEELVRICGGLQKPHGEP